MKHNIKKTLILFLVFISASLAILSGCKKSSDNLLASENSYVKAAASATQINVRLYKYEIGDVSKPAETVLFLFDKTKFETDTLNFLNEILAEDELSLTDAKLDKKNKCITADVSPKIAGLLNSGKETADAITNELVVTLQNMPGIEKVVLTVGGKKDSTGTNYNFKGTFVKTGEITFKRDETK
ncbi:MAG TPA: spore gernimation protein [Ruminiclostridium sp.]|nr:spore gernimation protein [Ruminiclostridium sp.]